MFVELFGENDKYTTNYSSDHYYIPATKLPFILFNLKKWVMFFQETVSNSKASLVYTTKKIENM